MKDGQRLTLRLKTNSGNTIRMDTVTLMTSYWKRIGVEATEEILEWSVLLDRWEHGRFDLVVSGWSLGIDPDVFSFFHSSQAARNPAGRTLGFNDPQFRNTEVDRLIDAGRATLDVAERRRIYHQIDVILNRELPYFWLFQRTVVTAIANRVQGVIWSPTGAVHPERWFVRH